MIPKRIQLENFLSFGKPAVEFIFTDDEPLWALCGRNGVGKSAVFDAITYALYGEHRGGKINAEQLIRHGANGFRIVFDFEFAGIDYRITRARSGRTSQKVECLVEGTWNAVDGVNSAPDVEKWVKRTLGLEYQAFTTSVLLRQGEADKLFSASRDDRIKLLKGIIGFERFEDVSQRIHSASQRHGSALDALRQRASGVPPVAPEELAAADASVAEAEQNRQRAQAAVSSAVQRVGQAKQWDGLENRRKKLEQQIDDARKRAGDAAAIRANKARLDDLGAVVPELQTLVALRDKIARLEPKIDKAKSEKTTFGADLEAAAVAAAQARQKEQSHRQQADQLEQSAKTLGEEIDRGSKVLQIADSAATSQKKLAAYPADLAEQLLQVKAAEEAAIEAKNKAAKALHAAEALLQQARERHDRFADVKAGAACSRCGQLVDAAHAAKERDHLNKDVQTRESETAQLSKTVNVSDKALRDARKRLPPMQKDKAEFDALAVNLQATLATLKQLGVTSNAAELRTHLEKLGQEKTQTQARAAAERTLQTKAAEEAGRIDKSRKSLEVKLQEVANALAGLEKDLTGARATCDAGLARLTPAWQAGFAKLDGNAVGELSTELGRLRTSGASERFELLRRDDEQQAEWSSRLRDICGEIDQIPAESRVSAQEAESALPPAKTAAQAAESARDAAVKTQDALKSRAEQHKELTAQLRTAERAHDLHKKLDDLLGQNGLQRELVRDAEEQIVDLANETLKNLSDHELSLEPDDDATGRDDKAFALSVRRAADALPTPVAFLSGSQKFRVAVSVAIAVGRFASGRAKPLEAVIIDEGFGSLDKDGLRAMAEELKRLQQSQSLKRVILVSHQDEFTDQFDVGYLLTPGENGTTAAPFRR